MKTDIFKMQQLEDENLEDYVERFLYNLHRARNGSLNEHSINIIFLKGIQEECIEILNLMSSGDISQKYFSDICDLCKKYSRSQAKSGMGVRDKTTKENKFVASIT